MFATIEAFASDRVTTGPLADCFIPSLIEDQSTGFRWLIAKSLPLQRGRWLYAMNFGAVGVVIPVGDGMLYVLAAGLNELASASELPNLNVPEAMLRFTVGMPDENDVYLTPEPVAPSVTGFVHLHVHTEFSPLDGLATVEEVLREAANDNQGAMAVTDHGVCAAHPEFSKLAQKAGIKPIFGIEANFVNARHVKESVGDYWHLILWAETDRGLRNLWAASTEAYREGFYGRARMDWDTLARHNEGVMCSTACLRGPLADAILADDEDTVRATLGRMQATFPDRLYVELHTNQLPEQKRINETLVGLAKEFSLPTIVVADSHYGCREDRDAHQVWIAAQTNKDLQDEADLFAGEEHYHVSTAAEVSRSISYLGTDAVKEAMANTVAVADRCHASLVERHVTPVYHRKGLAGVSHGYDQDAAVLRQMCEDAWQAKVGHRPNQEEYRERLETEMDLLVSKRFCGYMLLEADLCRWAKDNGILMGPGRGSAAGSLVCYLTRITEVDPIQAGLLFERFLTPGRTSLPDIDSDFPTSKRNVVLDYLIDRWGADRCVRVGTHIRLANRGVMRDTARVLQSTLDIQWPDVEAVAKLIEEAEDSTAGLGLSWEELWVQHGDVLEPYRAKYPGWFAYAERLVGRLKSYGKHAAGVVIDPEESIIDRLPLRVGEKSDQPITEFAMEDLEFLGFVKFDVLTIRNLDTIQMCLDLISADPLLSKSVPDVYSWTDEYDDPEVWDMLCEGDTLGVFQIETTSGTRLTKRFQPRSMEDLCAILTLVRPGPMRSGLTESYLRRRAGLEEVTAAHPKLEAVLNKTYQSMIYQEDIMAVCRVLGGYTMEEADEVRSILGKKKVEKVQSEGIRFVQRCTDLGVDRGTAEHLWEQMAEFAKYAFNRSHSWSYAMVAYWTAWFKKHYPAQFLVAVLSTVKKPRIPEFVEAARRSGYRVLPPDINESGEGFRVGSDRVSVRYGLDSVKGIGAAALVSITEGQPYTDFADFLARKGRNCNSGHVSLLASLGAFDSISGTHRASLEAWLEQAKSGELERCNWMDPNAAVGEQALPCTFDWTTEVRLGKTGKPLKPKPLPLKCTKACRQYTRREDSSWPNVPHLTDAVIREREREILGVYLTSTPFDDYTPEMRQEMVTGAKMEIATYSRHTVLAMVAKVRKHKDRTGREMGFVDLLTEDGIISAVMFNKEWMRYQHALHPDAMVLAYVDKTARGCNIAVLQLLTEKESING